jgi:REP element-mobilizing transposase RayT
MNAERPEKSGYAALRRNRCSAPQAGYFLTFNLSERGTNRRLHEHYDSIRGEWLRLESDRLWTVRTMVVMPDHLHLLLVLGEAANLSATIRLFKGRLAPVLRERGMHWQDGYHDRKLRQSDDRLPVFLYIFLNPHRAGLVEAGGSWPAYYCCEEDWAWVGAMTNADLPMPGWLH